MLVSPATAEPSAAAAAAAAIAAFDDRDHRAPIAARVASLAAARALHPPVAVPDPLRGRSGHIIHAGGQSITVAAKLLAPPVLVFSNVLSDSECDALIALSRSKLERSLVVDPTTGAAATHPERSSAGTYFHRDEAALVACIDERIAALLNWPIERGEPLQILHYTKGGEYRPHYDYFDPDTRAAQTHGATGGNRVATLIIYLQAPDEGGATTCPDIGFEVAPVRGSAVFFSYDMPDPTSLTLHTGAPVVRGEKWIATKWLRACAYVA